VNDVPSAASADHLGDLDVLRLAVDRERDLRVLHLPERPLSRDGRNGDTLAFSGLLVYDVDLERGFTRLGGVDHGTKGANSIADDRVKVQSLEHLGRDVADLPLTR